MFSLLKILLIIWIYNVSTCVSAALCSLGMSPVKAQVVQKSYGAGLLEGQKWGVCFRVLLIHNYGVAERETFLFVWSPIFLTPT